MTPPMVMVTAYQRRPPVQGLVRNGRFPLFGPSRARLVEVQLRADLPGLLAGLRDVILGHAPLEAAGGYGVGVVGTDVLDGDQPVAAQDDADLAGDAGVDHRLPDGGDDAVVEHFVA